MKMKAYRLDAFSLNEKGGNPAGVVIGSDHLSDQEMQKIAKIINLSETAFVSRSRVADFKVRFFTPLDEVDLCGHATVATFYLLFKLGIIKSGSYQQETKAGILNIDISKSGSIMMNQKRPIFDQIVEKDEILDSLKISKDELLDSPIEVVSTGIRDLMVGIKSLDTLLKIKPDMDKVIKISEKYDTMGYHLFTLNGFFHQIHTRAIAPRIGIPEEAATGTANGALSCYLYKHKLFNEEAFSHLKIEQGHILGLPSLIETSLEIKDGEILNVFVGGVAGNIKEIEISLL